MNDLSNIINELKTQKSLPEDLIKSIIEDFLKIVYKKRYGSDENAIVDFTQDNNNVTLFSKKSIVENVLDDVLEISLEEARKFERECEIGDKLLIEIKPESFTRTEILIGSQRAVQRLKEFENDSILSEFKNKLGEIVIGYYLRDNNRNIIVDLGRVEGILPSNFQSPKEVYRIGDKIKALVYSVEKKGNKLDVILSRVHVDFVKKIFELEIPEVYDGAIEIVKIVREPGYRIKVAVQSDQSDIDPVGTCVGAKGARINNIILELDNERIDVLKYDKDPLKFIHNALSPVEVKQVVVTDYEKKTALAIVEDEKFSIAIGKLGLNVRLANRLTDWNINVKTESEYKEIDDSSVSAKMLFDSEEPQGAPEEVEEIDISKVSELSELQEAIVKKLEATELGYIEDLLQISNNDLLEKGFTEDEINHIRSVISSTIEIKEEEASEQKAIKESSESTSEDEDSAIKKDEEEYFEAENLSVNALPLRESILYKLVNENINKLYDLVMLYSKNKLFTTIEFTDEEKKELEQVIQSNIQYEE